MTTTRGLDATRALLDPDRPISRAEHLLVLPLIVRVVDGRVLYDLQSRDSLVRYLDSTDSVIVALPRLAESRVAEPDFKGYVWVPADDLRDRVQFVPLPEYGSKLKFLREYRATARLLRRCIDAAKYPQFAIGGGNSGLEHDWAAVAAGEAIKAGRKFALHVDAISYGVTLERAAAARGPRRLPRKLALLGKAWLTRAWERHLVRRCDLMFCNGRDTFNHFAPLCKSPDVAVKINDFQIGPDKLLGPEGVERKCREALERPEVRVCYAGRVEEPKAPLQWVQAVGEARARGVAIRATWLGDGSLFPAMKREVERLGLSGVIDLPGFVTDRDRVIEVMRESDLLMFAHIDPESPRNLIESLMSACPIVGYERSHPADLISENGGGVMTPLGDPKAMGAAVAGLAADRPRLADLIRRAWRDGARFDSDVMSRERVRTLEARLA